MIDCMRKSINAVVISHEKEATQRLFSSVRWYIKNLEIPPSISIDSKNEIKFPKMESSYWVGTAGQRAFGRGDTVGRAHLSEAAFYDDLQRILNGIAEAAEYGQIDIETTANGREQFYEMWQKAKNGRSAYTPIFIPWFIDNEYSVDNMTEAERGGLSEGVQKLFAVSDGDFMAGLDQKEIELINKVKKEYGIELSAGQMKWRRYKIWDKGDFFFQEYPEDDESCFLQSGRSVFKTIHTDESLRIPLDNLDNWGTEEQRKAIRSRVLFGGIDCAEGIEDGDRHVFSVIDAPMDQAKAVVIYEYASTEPIDVFWSHILPILKSFRINLAIEKNGVGVAHCEKAKALDVYFTEWFTGTQRPQMICELEEAYRKDELIETYIEAENEARDMVYNKSNKAEAINGKHDDRPMSRAIAWQMRKQPIPGVSFV